MTLEQLYRNYPADTIEGRNARTLLFQTHWFSSIAEFDPRTGEALPQPLSDVLEKITSDSSDPSVGFKDRLWRITEHVRLSLEKLFHELNESPRREHAVLPIRAVRELDTTSFMAIARRPGRNIREKLAEKPRMLAVQRVQSVDLPENRLLKAFSEQLAELLELRKEFLGETDKLLELIRSWLWSDEAQSIGFWDNLPPNNTLLTHRDYRAVYDAWRWLQTLNDDLTADLKNLAERQKTLEQWKKHGRMYAERKHVFAEMPVLFDYDKFEIRSWVGKILYKSSPRSSRAAADHINTPVCIDLTELHPVYASFENKSSSSRKFEPKIFPESFLWQRWEETGTLLEMKLFKSDVLYLHPDAVTVSAPDLFFSHQHKDEHIDCAARAFASKLHEIFLNKDLVWLQPDFLNDFALAITRRSINTVYPGAQPLPRSIAAVFEKVDYKRLSNNFSVVVLDSIGGVNCATKLEAKIDEELKKCLPETGGFYWERHPSVILKELNEPDDAIEYDIATLNAQGKWLPPIRRQTDCNIPQDQLRQCKQIGQFDDLLLLSGSPVAGGLRFYELQERAGDIPLWRDQIPELSIKGWIDGRYERFYLVDRKTSVKAIRGSTIKIHVKNGFTLPVGKDCYHFPLFIGEDMEAGYSATLESPDFPLSAPLECRLNLTFTYGADDPYCLVFEPTKPNFQRIRVRWTKTEEKVVTNAPAPEYPQPLSWNDLRKFPSLKSNETADLLEWVTSGIEQLKRKIKREIGVITGCWRLDKKGLHFTFALWEGNRVFIHENNFINGKSYLNFSPGDNISFELSEFRGGYSGNDCKYFGKNIESKDYDSIRGTSTFIRKSLYFPAIQIWRDGHSISDEECPDYFRRDARNCIDTLNNLLKRNFPDEIKNEIFFLLSCLHKDTTEDCVSWLIEQAKNDKIINKQTVGFGLGDLSESWQEDIFESLIAHLSNDSLRVFAYAIWRHPDFVWKFSLPDYQAILDHLRVMLEKITPCSRRGNVNDERAVRKWVRSTVEPLELLLGLLRTRESSDDEIKMLLQPHQKVTKELARLVEKVTDIVAESQVPLFSRVQLGNLPPKPEGDHTPDLLYALRLYLTGDDGADAIQITGISDEDAN